MSPAGPPPITAQVRGAAPFMFAGATPTMGRRDGGKNRPNVVVRMSSSKCRRPRRRNRGGAAFAPVSVKLFLGAKAFLGRKGIPGERASKMRAFRRLGEALAAMLLLLAPAMWNGFP